MNERALDILRDVITAWKNEKIYTFENKQVYSYKSPVSNGEYILQFSNSLKSFFCKEKLIEINLTSRPFHTGTLSDNPISQNIEGDKHRLVKLLAEFDSQFSTEVDKSLSDCIESLSTSDPLFFK